MFPPFEIDNRHSLFVTLNNTVSRNSYCNQVGLLTVCPLATTNRNLEQVLVLYLCVCAACKHGKNCQWTLVGHYSVKLAPLLAAYVEDVLTLIEWVTGINQG